MARRKLPAYTLQDAQQLVSTNDLRLRPWRELWNVEYNLYATGTTDNLELGQTVGRAFADVLAPYLDRINMILPHLNIIIASITDEIPQFVVTPLAPSDGYLDEEEADAADAAEDYLKFAWRQSGATEVLGSMTFDAVVVGSGFGRVSWVYSEDTQDKPVDVLAAEISAGGDLDALDVEETIVVEDHVVADYVRPHDIIVSEDTASLETARWVAIRVVKPVDEWRAELNLGPSVVINTDPVSDKNRLIDRSDKYLSGPFQVATCYEFYDQRTGNMMVFQDGSDKPLWEGPTPTKSRKAPLVHLRNYRRDPMDFFGFGDLLNIAGLSEKLQVVFEMESDNMRRAGSYLLADKNAIDEDTKEALLNPELGRVVPITVPDGKSIAETVMAMQSPPIPADIYRMEDVLNSYMVQVLGLSDFQIGRSGASRMSGTAASAVEGNSSLRAQPKNASVSRAIVKFANLYLEFAAEYMSEPLTIRAVGVNGKYLRTISPDSLTGEFAVTVDAGSVTTMNPISRRQQAIETANVVVPLLASNGYDVEPVLRKLIRDLGEDPDQLLRKAAPEPAPAGPPGAGMQGPPVDPAQFAAFGPQDLVGGPAAFNNDSGSIAL